MKLLTAITIVIVWHSLLNNPLQTPIGSEKQSILELEKRAVSDTQRIPANELDNELPRLPFANWFRQLIGPEAGLVWQLTECGEIPGATPNSTVDVRACVEANTILSNERRVIVMIAVGTFKRGMVGAPAYYIGVIEHEEELYTIKRLRDLPELLSKPGSLANGTAPKFPTLEIPKVKLVENTAPAAMSAALNDMEIGQPTKIDAPPPPPPSPKVEPKPATATPKPATATSTNGDQKAPGEVLQGAPIVKVQPSYPLNAKRFNASGTVEVQVTISQTGNVINAKAVSGHPLLREAAVEASRKWVFKPTTMNGVPIETQLVLSFIFTVPQ
ncbi:MAG TPA: energy transducer TonB [Blastocatellia bacterium]|nr:energy transducer TonB [Blastocatellia bacterium]